MSIDYGKFRFATTPRTGTTWFIQACEAAGLGRGFKAHAHAPFNSHNDSNAFKLSLVRHPYEWLVSYYKAIHPGNTGIVEIDRLRTSCKNFEEFIGNYLRECPGQVGRIFSAYNADSYLRIEDMPWAASEFFASIGIPPSLRNKCRFIDPVNVSKGHIHRDLTVYSQVMLAEKETCERYEYF